MNNYLLVLIVFVVIVVLIIWFAPKNANHTNRNTDRVPDPHHDEPDAHAPDAHAPEAHHEDHADHPPVEPAHAPTPTPDAHAPTPTPATTPTPTPAPAAHAAHDAHGHDDHGDGGGTTFGQVIGGLIFLALIIGAIYFVLVIWKPWVSKKEITVVPNEWITIGPIYEGQNLIIEDTPDPFLITDNCSYKVDTVGGNRGSVTLVPCEYRKVSALYVSETLIYEIK